MRVGLLRAGLGLAGVLAVVVVGSTACGGKKPSEGAAKQGVGGSGGHGGDTSATSASSQSTSSSTSATSSTGTIAGCDCNLICTHAASCGVPSNACMGFCQAQSPATQQCLCAAGSACSAIQSCLTGAGTGSSTATGAGSSSGNLEGCLQCANLELLGPTASCSMFTDACEASTECLAIAQCHSQCGFGLTCKEQCDMAHPTGKQAYVAMISCAVCKMCPTACAGQQVSTDYCP